MNPAICFNVSPGTSVTFFPPNGDGNDPFHFLGALNAFVYSNIIREQYHTE